MKRILGFENSNSRIKAFDGTRALDYPNTIRRVRKMRKALPGDLFKGKTYELNGEYYQIGSISDYGSGSKDESRYTSEQFKTESIIALSEMCNPGDTIELVTGLPAEPSKNDELISQMQRNLVGTHEVSDGIIKKRFRINKVAIVSQPVGTLWSILYDIQGNKRVDDEVLNKNFLIIDIGFGTTDVVVLSAARGLDEEKSKTIDYSMGNYISNMMTGIGEDIPSSRISSTGISPYELDEMMRENNIITLPTGKFDISKLKDYYKEEFALELKNRLSNGSYTFDNYHEVILTGGGAAVMGDEIIKAFNNNRVRVLDNPRFANVNGFYTMAKQVF